MSELYIAIWKKAKIQHKAMHAIWNPASHHHSGRHYHFGSMTILGVAIL